MKKLMVLCLAAVLLAAFGFGCDLKTGSTSDYEEVVEVFEKPSCLEQHTIEGTQALTLCDTGEVFTYLVAPEVVSSFSQGGFNISPAMYGPKTNVEGVEVYFSAHPHSDNPAEKVLLGPQGGFVAEKDGYILISARSYVSDQQGHLFFSDYTEVRYKQAL